MHSRAIAVNQARAIEFAQNPHHATGTVYVFHMVFLRSRCDFRQIRHFTAQAINVGDGEVHTTLLRCGEQVQNGVGRAAHGDVQRHGVFKRGFVGNTARQCARVVLLVVAFGQFHRHTTGFEEQLFAIGVRRQQRTITRQTQAQGFGQAVHRVRREHARA